MEQPGFAKFNLVAANPVSIDVKDVSFDSKGNMAVSLDKGHVAKFSAVQVAQVPELRMLKPGAKVDQTAWYKLTLSSRVAQFEHNKELERSGAAKGAGRASAGASL